MRRVRAQSTQMKEERRWQIIQAAIPLFAGQGFTQTTVSEIAKAAGMSHGTIFLYFASKEDLFEATILEPLVKLEAQSQDLGYPDDPILHRLRHIVRTHFIAFSRQRNYLRLTQYVLGQQDRFPELAEALLSFGERFRYQLAPIINEGQRRGEIASGSAETIAHSYLSYIYGLALITPPIGGVTREALINMGVRIFGLLTPFQDST